MEKLRLEMGGPYKVVKRCMTDGCCVFYSMQVLLKPGAETLFGESFFSGSLHLGGVSLPPGREGEGLRWVAGAGFGK